MAHKSRSYIFFYLDHVKLFLAAFFVLAAQWTANYTRKKYSPKRCNFSVAPNFSCCNGLNWMFWSTILPVGPLYYRTGGFPGPVVDIGRHSAGQEGGAEVHCDRGEPRHTQLAETEPATKKFLEKRGFDQTPLNWSVYVA